MSDSKRLLAEATDHPRLLPLYYEATAKRELTGREAAYNKGVEDAARILVPDYEAAVDALERLGEQHHVLSNHNPGSVFVMRPAFDGLSECYEYTCEIARAALRRVRPGVPAA